MPLNVIKVLSVITFGPKCNKGPKCNNFETPISFYAGSRVFLF